MSVNRTLSLSAIARTAPSPNKVPIRYTFTPLKEATASLLRALSAHRLPLLLHDLADLDARVEELGRASVETHGLALVELALAVVGGNALLLAGRLEAAQVSSSVSASAERER